MMWFFALLNLVVAFMQWSYGDVAMTNFAFTQATVIAVGAVILGELRGR